MTSTVTSKGQTVVPKGVRQRYEIEPGATLDWQPEGDFIRVVKLAQPKTGRTGVNWLRRLGRIPAATRDQRPVEA